MNLTRQARKFLKANLPYEDMLPTEMPAYVSSAAYLFGVTSLSALAMLVFTGLVMALFGPTWYHHAAAGRFFNSMHFWSVQVFLFGMVSHGITKFLMAAWRDGRWRTWVVGLVAFAAAIATALTGYLAQTNFDSQWIAVQAKDLFNAIGLGSFFNPMNTAQVLTIHVSLLPASVVAVVLVHLFLIRRDSPVRPISEKREDES
jgi:quinol-cytochrome oxidoreductase complex cytochrome b subunit